MVAEGETVPTSGNGVAVESPFARPVHGGVAAEPGFVQAASTRLYLGGAGRVFLPLVGLALLLSWAAGGLALLLAAFGLATVLLTPLLAWRNLRGLSVRATAPGQHMVGESFLLELELAHRAAGGAAHDLLLAVPTSPRARLRPAGHVRWLRAGSRLVTPCAHRWVERGRYLELPLSIYSSYPFGLLRCERRFTLPVDLLALPRLGSLADISRFPSGGDLSSALERRVGQLEDEFYQLREWREGESLRRVHWKLSARRRRPILRDLRSRAEAPLRLVLHTAIATRAGERSGGSRSFETAVCLVATLGEHFLRRGRAVELVLVGGEPVAVTGLRGRTGLSRLLAILAEVHAEEEALDAARIEARLVEAARGREASIAVVVAGGRLEGARRGRRTGPGMVIDVESAGIDAIFQRGRGWGATPVLARVGGVA